MVFDILKIKNIDNYETEFLIKSPLFKINTLRKIIISQIKTVRIDFDKIYINNNTTLFYDEYVKHRLSLIPINLDFKQSMNDKAINKELGKIYVKIKCNKS